MARHCEMPFEMRRNDIVPFLFGHPVDGVGAQNAGVVDHDVESPEGIECLLDHVLRARPARDAVAIRNRFAARFANFADDGACNARICTAATRRSTAQIIDDDFRALLGQQHRFGAPDAAAGTRHDGDFSLEALLAL